MSAIESQLVAVCAECPLFLPGSLAVVVQLFLMDLLYRSKMAPSSQGNGSVAVDVSSVQLFLMDLLTKGGWLRRHLGNGPEAADGFSTRVGSLM